MSEDETIEYVKQMSISDKVSIYMGYFINMSCLKNNFEVVDLDRYLLNNINKSDKGLSPYNGWGIPSKEFNRIAFYYLHQYLKIKSLDEFCDKSNIQINDAGIDNWEERGFASKRWIIFKNDSIYHYIFANA